MKEFLLLAHFLKGFDMRHLFPFAMVLLIGCALALVAVDAQDKEAKKTEEKPKESLVKKQAKETAETLANFPYPETTEGRKFAEKVATVLNSAEDLFAESATLRKESKSEAVVAFLALDDVMLVRQLRHLSVSIALRKEKWIVDDKPLPAKYSINWDGKKWAVKELPKKEKK